MGKGRILGALIAAGLLGGAVTSDASAAIGDLTQKPGPGGCVSESAAGPCVDGTALDGASSVTVSPDGRSAYVASTVSSSVAAFARAGDGTLTQSGCVSETAAGPCVDGAALAGASAVAVSPDGRSAYVASSASGAVAVFDRGADGTLTQRPGTPGCISEIGVPPCADGTALDGASSVTVGPDGRSVYVASATGDAVAIFDRAADGTLTQKGCVSETGAGPCVDGTALDGASSVTVAPDGRSAYVASSASGALAIFDRAADGTLTQKGCVSEAGAAPCADGTALAGASSVTVSPDGRSVYVASATGDAVAAFDRAADGTLTQKGCVSDTGTGPCVDGRGLDGAVSVTVSPDARSVYVASATSDAVAVLDREAFQVAIPAGPPVTPSSPAAPILPLVCSGRSIVLLDVHRAGRRVEVSGLARTEYRGRRTAIRSLIKGSRPAYATIQSDGSFRTTLPLPPSSRRANVRYQATIAGLRSATLKLARQLTIVSRRATPAGTRITVRLSRPNGRRRVTIARQLSCTRYQRLKVVRTNRAGRVTIALPAPRAPEPIAYYRATTQRGGGRTYSLPIAVRATTPP